MHVSFSSHAPRTIPLTLLAGVVTFVALHAGCSDEAAFDGVADAGASSSSGNPSDARAERVGCRTGEREQSLAGGRFCCPSSNPVVGDFVFCFEVDAVRAGDDCTDEEPMRGAKLLTFTTDSCVSESCDGDLETVTFNAETELTEGQLRCSAETRKWAPGGALIRSAKVSRVCQQDQVFSCGGGGYGYGSYGGQSATQRAVTVLESTCREGDGASIACAVGNL